MKLFKRTWTALSWLAGGYAAYNQLKTLNQAKNELYDQLSPEQQAEWVKVFGHPGEIKINTPTLPPVKMVSDLEKIASGV